MARLRMGMIFLMHQWVTLYRQYSGIYYFKTKQIALWRHHLDKYPVFVQYSSLRPRPASSWLLPLTLWSDMPETCRGVLTKAPKRDSISAEAHRSYSKSLLNDLASFCSTLFTTTLLLQSPNDCSRHPDPPVDLLLYSLRYFTSSSWHSAVDRKMIKCLLGFIVAVYIPVRKDVRNWDVRDVPLIKLWQRKM